MNYDDTLSVALGDGNQGIAAAWPVHGGILSLNGSIGLVTNKTRVGIDTDTGYARALRYYLRTVLLTDPQQYAQLDWVYAGASHLRYEKLMAGQLDATLLNLPFSVQAEQQGIKCTPLASVLGPYHGTVANIRKAFLKDEANRACLDSLAAAFDEVLLGLQTDPEAVTKLAAFFKTTEPVALGIFDALWQLNGLAKSLCFNTTHLAGTEAVYGWDTKTKVPADRSWVLEVAC